MTTATREQLAGEQRAARRGRRRPGRRPWPVAVLAVVMVGMLVYLLWPYVPPDMGTSRIPPRGELHYGLLVAHIFTAAVATLTGPAQFWPWLRRRYPAIHRWSGRAYFFLGVFPSSVIAVPVAVLAPFGAANQAALLTLDALWLGTALAGYRAVRGGRYPDHRRWMIRNFALTVSSIASRFWIPVMVLAALPQANTVAYRGDQAAMSHDVSSGSAWLALVTTLLAAEWYIQRRYGVPARSAPRR